MSLVNQLIEQTRSFFSSLPMSSRLIGGLLIVAIVLSFVFLVRNEPQSNSVLLFDGYRFSEADLQRVEMALSAAPIDGFEIDAGRVRIPSQKREECYRALAKANALPPDLGSHLDQVFAKSNPFESTRQFEAKTIAARERDIALALKALPFIEYAYVTYDEQRQGFVESTQKTAAVWIMPEGQPFLTHDQKRAIAKQVQASFAGLDYKDVHVMDLRTGMDFGGSEGSLTDAQQRLSSIKIQEEANIKEKVRGQLAEFGNVRIEVNLEFDPTWIEESDKVEYATPQFANQAPALESNESPLPSRVQDAPTVMANRKAKLTITRRDSTESHDNVASREVRRFEKAAFRVDRASAVVSIPRSYYSRVYSRTWMDENSDKLASTMPPMSQNVMLQLQEQTAKKIESILAIIMPRPSSPENLKIIVTDYLDEPATVTREATWLEKSKAFIESSWQTLALLALALVALLVMRSALISTSRSNANQAVADNDFGRNERTELPFGESSRRDFDEDDDWAPLPATSPLSVSGTTPKGDTANKQSDDFESLVKETPQVSTLLRDWISEAA